MPETLTNIQDQVRHLSRDDSVDITTGTGLGVANRINRGLASFIEPDELIQEDTSLTTASGTETYTWPASPVFTLVFLLEIQDTNNSDKYRVVKPSPNWFRWNRAGAAANGFPWYFKRIDVSGTHKLDLRPIPDFVKTIRITGQIEPTAFSDGNSTTTYLRYQIDDALALLIAADYLAKRAQGERAAELLQSAASQLSQITGREIKPQQLKEFILDG